MKSLIIGAGYVGLATAFLLKNYPKVIYDTSLEVIQDLDEGTHSLLNEHNVDLNDFETIESLTDLAGIDLVFICVPTPMNNLGNLNTCLVTSVIEQIRTMNKSIPILVRSTVPIGFTRNHNDNNLHFFPEFLVEKNPFNLNIDRFVISENAPSTLVEIIQQYAKVITTDSATAEAIKLYSNSYLATRLAFFYEMLDFSNDFKLNFDDLKDGVCSDKRIGNLYSEKPYLINGKCLPKDLSQLSKQTNSKVLHGVYKVNKLQEIEE